MSVYLNPSSALGFNRPLTTLVRKSLTITNPNAQPVAFKVKTTAPKLYCVRPNAGRVEPGESVEVTVMLQALREEPPMNAKCKDKFLIQSTLLTPGKEGQDIWSVPEGASDEAKIHQQKLKVAYLPPEGQTLEEEDETQLNQSSMLTTDSVSTLFSFTLTCGDVKLQTQFDTVRQQPFTNGHSAAPIPQFSQSTIHEPVRSPSPPVDFTVAREESHEPEENLPPPPVSVFVQPPAEPVTPVEQVRSLSPSPPSDELLIKYQDAQAEIERLRSLLAAAAPPQETRRRTRRLSNEETTAPSSDVGTLMMDDQLHQEGVPLQVVVIIALGVFITTYLFF
ncbi:PapD-like protein [Mycena floridula]|nr:PapD-like protein [Mycena floridula]